MGKKSKSKKPSSIRDFFAEEVKPILPVGAGITDKSLKNACEESMHTPLKLIDENFEFRYTELLSSFSKNNTGFLVVGVIGRKGVGKSTVANLVANAIEDEPNLETPFPVQSVDTLVSGYSETQLGIDLFITHDRVIILDTQPLIDWTVADIFCKGGLHGVKTKPDYASSGEFSESSETGDMSPSGFMKNWSVETVAEIVSLQLISFLASVCHAVILVQDNLSDPTLLQLVDHGFGWKPLVLVNQISLVRKAKNKTAHILRPSDSKVMEGGDKVGIEDEIIDVNEAPSSDTKDLDQSRPDELPPPHDMENPFSDARVPTQTKCQSSCVVSEEIEVQNYLNKLRDLTDYSASLLHVYNCAPVDVFTSPDKSYKLLKQYNNLLTRIFPMRLELESFVNLGPRILKKVTQNRRKAVRNHLSSGTFLDDEDDESDVLEDVCDQQGKNKSESEKDSYAKHYGSCNSLDLKNYLDVEMAADKLTNEGHLELPLEKHENKTLENGNSSDARTLTEEEIVADFIEELSKLKIPPRAKPCNLPRFSKATCLDEKTEERDGLFYAGDCENVDQVSEMRNAFKRITLERKQKLHVSSSVATSHLFVLPAINENGEVEVGSPSYWECAYHLQEAILSTPRRHPVLNERTMTELQWLDFARDIWKTLSSKETSYLFDYHRLMVMNLF
ncbi:unnamed protein product [Rodentolepis nana]|uniref:Protein SMG9 n=1 Tax=Rodentolepis nana TaxID=102285 RepID=A0A0R3T539_RODNA|nr:unnamed protein product [Rodentolepis nana]